MTERNYDHYWLLTWTTYATWLPGDDRGHTGTTRERGVVIANNMIGTPIGDPVGSLRDHATEQLNGTPVYLQASHAEPCLLYTSDAADE